MSCKYYFFSGAYNQKLKIKMNIDQLFSAYHEKALVTKIIKYKKEHLEYTARIMLDSGAFSHYQNSLKKGIVLTDKDMYEYTDSYLEFLNEWGDDLFCFVAVDTVPNPENVDPTAIVKTWENYLYMYDRLRPEIRNKLIVTFHYQEDIKWLKNMLEYRHTDGTPIDYIGIAISTESSAKLRVRWAKKCAKIISESSNPHVKTHAFGVGVKTVLEEAPFTSADATSWVKRAAFGNIAIDDKTVCISDIQKDNLNKGKHYSEKNAAYTEQVKKIIKERGFTEEELESNSNKRAEFNIIDTIEWVKKLNEDQLEKDAHISINELW